MIVDVHMHIGTVAVQGYVDTSIEAILAQMDHLEIDVSISAGVALLFGRPVAGFEEAVEAYRMSAGRILSYAYFSPYYIEEDLKWVRKCLEHEAFVGIKIYPGVGVEADDERWNGIWRLASELDVPILAHTWWISDYNPVQRYSTPDLFEQYVKTYPEVKLILGHAGGRYEGHRASAALARAYPNVFMDLSGDTFAFGVVEWLVEHAGADRIMYGSDLFMLDGRPVMGRILDADVSLDAKQLILGENAARLFGLNRRSQLFQQPRPSCSPQRCSES
jgi:uncharacterized protein